MRTLVLLYAAAGMLVSFVSGYELMYRDLVEARDEAREVHEELATERGRVEVLKAWSRDRDAMDDALHGCYVDLAVWMNAFEDQKWQMSVVIDSCPGRVRPPDLPRP